MRLRNVKNADELENNSSYFINNPEDYKNKWNTLFNNDNQINLEIGMGKGDFIIGMAQEYPNINFIGVEKYKSVLVRALQKLESLNLKNVKIIEYDAINLNNVFDKEIDTLYLNFSDPWPKNRHHKRRLTYKSFLEVYDKLFKGNAKIELKTDNDIFFESSLIDINNYGYKFDEVILDLWASNKPNVRTEYEIKFSNLGFKIKYLKAHKNLI